MHQVLKSFLRRLTNLTSNNRSLLLLRLNLDHFIDLHDFDYLLNEPSFQLIQQLVGRTPKIKLAKVLDSRDEQTNRASQRLKKIVRNDNFIFEERGSRDLYLGWPFVRGKLADDTLIRCPLLFFPVELSIENDTWVMNLRQDVNINLNKSFLLAYSYYNQVVLEEQLLDFSFDDYDQDSRIFRTHLYQLLKESPVELNFNQELFLDKLIPFEEFSKDKFRENERTGELKVYSEAVLGIFPQAGSQLVPDYLQLINSNQLPDIEEFFHSKTLEEDRLPSPFQKDYYYFLNKIKEEKTFTPFELDAFQENAIKAVKRGNSLVVHGPPGSGKSQLICNLIADFIATGKRVLLVCQKRAALDVVAERLKEKGLDDFIALVHDFKNDRKAIYEQVQRQIENLHDYKLKNNSLDSIQLERSFLQASRRIDQINEELEEFKQALFDDQECGLSAKELYLTSDLKKPSVNLKQEYRFLPFGEVQLFLPKLKSYITYAGRLNNETHPWGNRVKFKDFGIGELKKIQEAIDEIPAFQQQLADKTEAIVNSALSISECDFVLSREEKIKELLRHLNQDKVFEYFRHMVNYQDKDTDYLWLGTVEKVLLDCFKEPGLESSLQTAELGKFQNALHRRMRARSNFIKYLRWIIFSKDKSYIRKVMAANELQVNRKGFQTLLKKLDNRLNLEHNITKTKLNKALTGLPETYQREDYVTWFGYQKKAVLAKLIFSSLRNFKEYFNIQKIQIDQLKEKLELLLLTIREVPAKKAEWLKYLSPSQIYYIQEDAEFTERLRTTLKKDFDSICDFDQLEQNLKSYELDVIHRIVETTENYDEEKAEQIFQNSIRLAWIEHLETKFPVLRAVSSIKLERLEQELQENMRQKKRVSREILLLKARERTFNEIEFNRLNNMVTYRDLKHQVSKKKKIWPIRKLVENHANELFELVPCWMASPESVSAIFPMEPLFDLVVFDEASQCFVEKGIPAMYRGRQVVIAGDENQLSPFDLYQIRFENEQEEDPLLEIESLLELGKNYLMQVSLNGHYRSQSLDLIGFSNHHFYQDKLQLLPDRLVFNKKEPGIHYLKVDGAWENQVNHAEAIKVTQLIEELVHHQPEKSLGVVTFNQKQQGYIIDLLESSGHVLPDEFFVKNIENVQGDERDIIIFSLAYGPDNKGKLNLNFGSLNALKGENRLNVAVTRAREKIYLVTSIWPEQLKTENTKNDGPKLLKSYLQYAREVSEGNYKPQKHKDEQSENWYLKQHIQQIVESIPAGISCNGELPFTDLTLCSNGDYLGLILTDDQLYHQSISVKESHVYKPFLLGRKNWPYRSFFSREYWHDPETVKERLLRFVQNLKNY